MSCSILIVNRGIVSPTLNVNLTLFITSCIFWGIIDLQCCIYYHLPADISSKPQSSMTIFHRKFTTREGIVLANEWTHPSFMTVIVYLFIRSVIRKLAISDIKYVMTLNIIFCVGRSCIQLSMTKQGFSQCIGNLSASPGGLINEIMYSSCFTFVSQRCWQSISNQKSSLSIRKLYHSMQRSFMYHKALLNHKIQSTFRNWKVYPTQLYLQSRRPSSCPAKNTDLMMSNLIPYLWPL